MMRLLGVFQQPELIVRLIPSYVISNRMEERETFAQTNKI